MMNSEVIIKLQAKDQVTTYYGDEFDSIALHGDSSKRLQNVNRLVKKLLCYGRKNQVLSRTKMRLFVLYFDGFFITNY